MKTIRRKIGSNGKFSVMDNHDKVISSLHDIDPSITIGPTFGTATAWDIGVYQSGELHRNAEFPWRYRVYQGGGIYVNPCDGKRSKYVITLGSGARIGRKHLPRTTPESRVDTIVVFPLSAVIGVERYQETYSVWE